jgi:hypothetical protein
LTCNDNKLTDLKGIENCIIKLEWLNIEYNKFPKDKKQYLQKYHTETTLLI